MLLTSDNNKQKNCGFCGESIPLRAGRCPYCGSILEVTVDSSYHIDPQENTAVPQNAAAPEKPNITGNPDITENPVTTGEPGESEKTEMTDHYAKPMNPGTQNESGIAGNNDTGARLYNNFRPIPERKPENYGKYPLSNGMKVFLTVICTIIPGLGQLAGIIAAIVFMNSDDDSDRKSFGVALLVASLIMFVFACIGCFILVIAISSSSQMLY